jgi:hypothetical protein
MSFNVIVQVNAIKVDGQADIRICIYLQSWLPSIVRQITYRLLIDTQPSVIMRRNLNS